MSESIDSDLTRVEVGRFTRLAEARERGLVIAAMGLPYWIEREEDEWLLLVEEAAVEDIRRELDVFDAEQEQQQRLPKPELVPAGPFPKLSLFVAAWILTGFFIIQLKAGAAWEESGVADAGAILAGQWWRTVTALTLHGDGPHLVANLATGLLFAAFLIPRLGSGLSWLAILLSGALGNALNAWGYRGETHLSIGASTACFGALGILVGIDWVARWREPRTRSRWQLILPIGAGLGLLAYLGVGGGDEGKHIDFMAHFWGFTAGVVEGALAEGIRLKAHVPERAQKWVGLAAILILGLAWALANHSESSA